jgi:hypothetical protein
MKICGAEKVQLYNYVEVPGQLRDSGAYPREYSPRHPLEQRLGGPQSQSGLYGKEKNLLSLPGFESHSCSLFIPTCEHEMYRY